MITRGGWFLLAAMGLMLAGGICWMIFGVVETLIVRPGAISAYEAVVRVRHEANGWLSWLGVDTGDWVEAGQTIGLVTPASESGALMDGELSDEARQSLLHSRRILCPSDGRVVAVHAEPGDNVTPATDIVTIVLDSAMEHTYVIALVPAQIAGSMSIGTPAYVWPAQINDSYGYISGFVCDVSSCAIDYESAYYWLGDREAAEFISTGEDSMVAVLVTLDTDENNELVWSSGKTPVLPVSFAMQCEVEFVLERKHPIETIFSMEVN